MSKEVILTAAKACATFSKVRRDIEKQFAYDDEYIKAFFDAMEALKQALDDL